MKPFLLLAGLLLAASPAPAQTASGPGPAPVPVAAPAPVAPDTLAAIHRLFAAKRRRSNLIVGGTLAAALGFAGVVVANRPAESSSSNGSGFGVVAPNNLDLAMVGIVTALVVPTEALLLGGWGPKYEQQVAAAWQQHQLPRAVERRLKARYFR